MIRYPEWGGWVLLVAGFALLALARLPRLGVGWRQALGGTAGVAALMVGTGAVSHFVAKWAYGTGMIPMRERVNEMDAALWIFGAVAAAAVLLAKPRAAMWTGAVILMLLSALAAQIWMAEAGWLFGWGGVIGAALLCVAARKGTQSNTLVYGSALVGGLWGALLLAVVIVAYMSIGPRTPAPVALVIPLAIALIGPVIMAFGDAGWSRRAGGGLVAAAAIGALVFAFSASFSERYPKPGDLFHYTDARTGKSYWATTSTERQLPGGVVNKLTPKGFDSLEWLGTAAPMSAISPPVIVSAQNGATTTVRLTSAPAPRMMNFVVTPSRDLSNVRVNGRPVKLPAGKPTRVGWRAETPNAELVLTFEAGGAGNLAVDYLYALPGMPAGAPPSGGPDTDWTLLNGTRVLGGSAKLDFAPE